MSILNIHSRAVFLSFCLLIAALSGGCISTDGTFSAGSQKKAIALNSQEQKLVGTWGGKMAGVVVGVVYYYPDKTSLLLKRNSGKTRRVRGNWGIRDGLLSYDGAQYQIVSFSENQIVLKARTPVAIGYDNLKLQKYSNRTDIDSTIALEQVAENTGFNDPIDFRKWADAADNAMRAWGIDPDAPRAVQPQRSGPVRCGNCGGSGMIAIAPAGAICNTCGGDGYR